MDSVLKHRIRQRISLIYDVCMGAQASSKDIAKYVKSLSKSVGIQNEGARTKADFLRDFGGGM